MRIIGGKFKGHPLVAPKGSETRPTSSQLREAVFNIGQGGWEGASILDLFCGSGAIGLEALSRGATSATFVDTHPAALQALKQNLAKLHLTGTIFKLDALTALKKLVQEGTTFDFIYVDPPYEAAPKKMAPASSYAATILDFIDRSPLLKPEGTLFIEEGGPFQRKNPLTTLIEGRVRSFGKSQLFQFRNRYSLAL